MARRRFLSLLGAGVLSPGKAAVGRARATGATLRTAKLELGGAWEGAEAGDVSAVIERMRAACLTDVALLSDEQPEQLRVDDRSGGGPSIWLHAGSPRTAWIIVNINGRDWCNLAYQFGHELGHVLCNSWDQDAKPRPPCQWIEEALVEAFSFRGLALLADAWESAPPFPDDAAYARDIRIYRQTILTKDLKIAQRQRVSAGFKAWFERRRAVLEGPGGLDVALGAVPTMLEILESDTAMVTDMGALNRWPQRSGLALHDYLDCWEKSCAALNAPGRLPRRLRESLLTP